MKNNFANLLILNSVLLPMAAHAADDSKTDHSKLYRRIQDARTVLQELGATPDKSIPLEIAAKATCVAVVPGFKKGAFLVGGQYGQGVATCRGARGWSAPVFIQITGASFGLQAGAQSTDLVLVGVSRHSMTDLLKDKLKLGGDIAVAAGPVGRDSQASTTELANAGFLTYSRTRGIFAGVDLSGDVVNQNQNDTAEFYGKDIAYKSVLSGAILPPEQAKALIASVKSVFHTARVHAGPSAPTTQSGDAK